jgi:pimeloyl-ACP methyl ester carboxylesterase
VIELVHARIRLALHPLRESDGPTLLLLHGLGESSPGTVPDDVAAWPGSVFALDFTGHGQSELPVGGGYTAELLMADADAALAHLGAATLVGRGLGGYVAALLAGGRPASVRGVAICDGPGQTGFGPAPGPSRVPTRVAPAAQPPDPFALEELARDVRPPDYVRSFAREAADRSGLSQPISACGAARPEWLIALLEVPGTIERPLAAALEDYARATPVR